MKYGDLCEVDTLWGYSKTIAVNLHNERNISQIIQVSQNIIQIRISNGKFKTKLCWFPDVSVCSKLLM